MRPDEKRIRLLEATERVLRERGLAGATTREIVRAAGVAEGTLYLYFNNRAELFLALFDEHLKPFVGPLRALLHGPPAQDAESVLMDLALRFLAFQRGFAPLLASLFAEPELLAMYRAAVLARTGPAPRVLPPLVSYLRAQQRAGRISKRADPATLGEAFLGACFSHVFHDVLFDEPVDAKADRRFVRRLLRTLIR